MKKSPYLSVVIPVYGCAQTVEELYHRLVKTLSEITDDFEIVMVNDHSPDNAWDIIMKLGTSDSRVRGINLSRNYGQHRAITAGLDYARGEWIVVMDCDLQDLPEEIPKLYKTAMEGYDVVFGRRIERKDSFFKRFTSKANYTIFNYLSGITFDESVANFSIISKKVADAHRRMREQNRSYSIFTYWMGFRRKDVDIAHAPRKHGKSTYSFKKLLTLAIDGIVAHSNKPLRLSVHFGFILATLTLIYAIWLIIRYFLYDITVPGWTSVMVSIYFIGGLLFANLGILGIYIGKIFNETKKRPLYLIQETTFDTNIKDHTILCTDGTTQAYKRPYISVVTPVYGCGRALPELYKRLVKTLTPITENFDIIMINDQSPDEAWNIISQLANKDPRVKGINLSRNFGQHRAITAGLDYADGEWVVVMDCDLQDQPEEIVKLYNKAQEGYDVVFGRRVERKDTFFKKLSSKLFNKVFTFISGMKTDSAIANFSIVSHKVIENFRKMKEQNRGYAPFVSWLGFKRAEIDIAHAPRAYGKSSYSLRKLVSFAVDSIVAHSNKPLRLSIEVGFLMTFLSILYAIWLIIKYFIYGVPVQGWTSVMVSIYFIGGLLFANLGILGLYIGKIFNETKNRPLYVVSETTFDREVEQNETG